MCKTRTCFYINKKRRGKSMKICKKFLKTVFAVLLAFGLMTNTYHAFEGEATITITKGEGVTTSLKGMKVDAYMILNQFNPNETDVSKKQYEVVSAFRTFFNIEEIKSSFVGGEGNVYLTYDETEAKLKVSADSATGSITISKAKLDTTYPEASLLSRITRSTDVSTFYTWVEKYIETKSVALSATATATASESSATLESLDEGYYALIFSNVPAGVVVKQGIMIPTSGTSASIPLKAEPITVEKKVSKDENNFYDEISAAMNTSLTYQITTKVPTLADFSNLTEFKLTDTMTHQNLEANSFTLTIGSTSLTYDYDGNSNSGKFKKGETVIATITTTAATFSVDFVEDALKDHQGQDVVLKYTAQLTSDAIDVNNNTVTLNYTNGPDTKELTDSTKVYTYGIDVTKKFSDGSTSTENYGAVKFSLYTDSNDTKGTAISLVGSAGNYHVPASGETTTTTTLSLTNTGKLTITGLDAGTYWLVETAAPDGFTKAGDIKITLVAGEDGALDETNSKVETASNVQFTHTANSIALAQFEVLNQKGFNLPTTGGAGTMMITLGGMALIVVAAGLYVVSKKKKA